MVNGKFNILFRPNLERAKRISRQTDIGWPIALMRPAAMKSMCNRFRKTALDGKSQALEVVRHHGDVTVKNCSTLRMTASYSRSMFGLVLPLKLVLRDTCSIYTRILSRLVIATLRR